MLKFDNVRYRYAHATDLALDGVTLSVSPGERVVLMGQNGSGKSTIASLANASLVPTEGTVEVDGLVVGRDNARTIASIVSEVRQDPRSQLLSPTVWSEVAFGPRCMLLPREEIDNRVREALALCGIEHLMDRETSALSGSEQQLLAIAGALAMHPRYLVLDEAETYLDPASRAVLAQAVDRLLNRGVGVLQITHEARVAQGATRAYLLEKGKLLWEGEPSQYLFGGQLAPKTTAASTTSSTPIATQASVTQTPSAGNGAPEDMGLTHGKELRMEKVSAGYADTTVLSDLSLVAKPGDLTILSGPSGSGKSTAVAVLAGVHEPTAGQVTLGDAPVKAGMVGLASQYPEDQLFADTVEQDVAFGPHNLGLADDEVERRVSASLAALGIPASMRTKHPSSLSGGWRRRVALAGILAMKPEAYLFDEPLAGLDVHACELMRNAVADLVQSGSAVAVATHDSEQWHSFSPVVHPLHAASATSTQTRLKRFSAGPVLLSLVLLTIALFSTHSARGVVLAFVTSLAMLCALRARPRDVMATLKATTVVLAFVLFASSFVVDGTADLPIIGSIGISLMGLSHGVVSALRIVSTVLLVHAVAMMVPTSEVAEAIVSLFHPLGAFGVPVGDLAMVVSVALGSTPLAIKEFERIQRAQLVRGARFNTGSLRERITLWSSVLIPLVISLFDVADGLSRAMHDRCYNGELTPMNDPLSIGDIARLVLVMVLSIAIWLV